MKKFKIKETGVIAEKVEPCHISINGFVWHEESIAAFGLTLEPIEDTPKKLYAYRYNLFQKWDEASIIFYENEINDLSGSAQRAPEYDLTFQKETK